MSEQTIIQAVPIQVNPARVQSNNLMLLLQYGGSAVAIILSISILLLAIAEMIKVLVPVMLQGTKRKTDKETKSS